MRMTFIAAPAHEPDKACSVCLFYLGNEYHGESPGGGALHFPLWPTALHQDCLNIDCIVPWTVEIALHVETGECVHLAL